MTDFDVVDCLGLQAVSDRDIRVVSRPDGTIAYGALTMAGIDELTILMDIRQWEKENPNLELLEDRRLFDGMCYMAIFKYKKVEYNNKI